MIIATIIITIMTKNIDKKIFSKVPNMGMLENQPSTQSNSS